MQSLQSSFFPANSPAKAEIRVIDLFIVPNAVTITTLPNGEPIEYVAPGRVLLYDAAGSQVAISLEVNLEGQNPPVWISLPSGTQVDFTPGQFNRLQFKATLLYGITSASPSSLFAGRIYVSPSAIFDVVRFDHLSPAYTQPPPMICTILNAGFVLFGGADTFKYYYPISGYVTWGTRLKAVVRNIGIRDVWLSSSAQQIQAWLYPLGVGEEKTIEIARLPTSIPATLFAEPTLTSGLAVNALYAFSAEADARIAMILNSYF